MYVRHLQEYLDKFTEGQQGRRGNAVSDAKIYICLLYTSDAADE